MSDGESGDGENKCDEPREGVGRGVLNLVLLISSPVKIKPTPTSSVF